MNKKGFTLVELLSIIVILAIIAVITVPIITNIIEKSSRDSAGVSALGYMDAVEIFIMAQSQDDENFELDGNFNVVDGSLSSGDDLYEVRVNGTVPTNGFLIITGGNVVSGCLTFGKYAVNISDENVSEISMGRCFEFYTLTFDSNGGTNVDSISILGGRTVAKPNNPTKDGVKFLGWYTDTELTSKFDFDTLITQNITLYAKWGIPSFADDSWRDIKDNLASDRNFYSIGSTKLIHFDMDSNGTDEYYELRLANTESCGDYTGSRTSCGVVIEFVSLIGMHNMNTSSTSVGGWFASDMRRYLNPQTETYTNNDSIFSKLPSDLQNVIIPTAPVISSSDSDVAVVASEDFEGDRLYLLSAKEVGFNFSADNKQNDTKTLKFYVDNTGSSAKVKYSSTSSTDLQNLAKSYWLRSAPFDFSTVFFYVTYSGGYSQYHANNNDGVAPAFRILD